MSGRPGAGNGTGRSGGKGTGHDVRGRTDTPETKHPDRDVECLGPEATAYLTAQLPVGSEVTLEYDTVRLDRYGRTLAGVVTSSGVLVNAEIARQGLGVAVEFDGNVRFLADVQRAQQEASAAQRGLYSSTVMCTIPAQVAAVSAVATTTTTTDSTSAADLSAVATGVEGAARVAAALLVRFDGDRSALAWAVLTPDSIRTMRGRTPRRRRLHG